MTRIRSALVMAVVAMSGGAGCATMGPSSTDLLQERRLFKRAALDLDCARGRLAIVKIDEATRRVNGCGQQAIYVELCDAPWDSVTRQCTWLLNGAIRPIAQ